MLKAPVVKMAEPLYAISEGIKMAGAGAQPTCSCHIHMSRVVRFYDKPLAVFYGRVVSL